MNYIFYIDHGKSSSINGKIFTHEEKISNKTKDFHVNS